MTSDGGGGGRNPPHRRSFPSAANIAQAAPPT